jgi:hypothetical protein
MLSSVLTTEEEWGTVTRITVPPAYADDLRGELLDASRGDLAAMVEVGQDGRLVVTAGGAEWPFGGL